MKKPDMAIIIDDYINKKYKGKSKVDIERIANDYYRKNGVTEDSWEDENPVPLYANDINILLKRFSGNVPAEIEVELGTLDHFELEETHNIVQRLSSFPDFEE